MATPLPDDDPLALIDRLLAGILHLIAYAQGRPERAHLERSWWSLRSLKHGAEAALVGVTSTPRSLSRTGRSMLIAYCDAERSSVYRCAAHLGMVPRAGTGTSMDPGCATPPGGTGNTLPQPPPAGQSLGNLMGL